MGLSGGVDVVEPVDFDTRDRCMRGPGARGGGCFFFFFLFSFFFFGNLHANLFMLV